ncbi:MAG TPA: hypothetical protein VFU34_00675, partial [Gaiellaceae bacterium]|nr:hypothetical protein [Gaiellaceae bacterium]
MAVKLPTIAELVDARWFAGKGRAITGAEQDGRLAPEGGEGAAVVFLVVTYEDGGAERYALPLRNGHECGGDDPLWTALARLAGVEAASARSRFLAEDLSNTVVAIDDRRVLKLFRLLEEGTHPEAEVLEVLAGFAHVPALEGVVEHDGTTVAIVEEYVDGTPVGWEDLIGRLAAGEGAIRDAADLGRVAAALHGRLAAAMGTRLGDSADVAAERAGARPRASDSMLVGAELSHAIDSRLALFDRLLGARLQRVHGDLHVAQVLRTERGLVVIDFEGDPSLPLRERSRERSPLVDLASLLLSLDHAGCAAAQREPSFDWRSWSRAARAACLAGYESEGGAVDR